MVRFFVGLDLGQANDYTALSILERRIVERESSYDVRRLERVRGMPYPDIIDRVTQIMRSTALINEAALIVDQTGVGQPVVDSFRKAGLKPIGIMIHGGDRATREGSTWRVPKRDLVGVLQVLLQNSRLRVSWKLKLAKVLSGEMLNFKVKIDQATAHDSYSAWREADHDDLLLAVALAAWYGERLRPRRHFKVPPIVAFNSNDLDNPGGAVGELLDSQWGRSLTEATDRVTQRRLDEMERQRGV
jgi:hypothetical protein